LLPFLGITERYLFESHTIVPGGAGNVQVTVDNGVRPEPQMPCGGPLRPAPLGEFGVAQDPGRIADQREMIHQDGRHAGVQGLEPPHGHLDPGLAPCFPARVGIGMQQQLVGAHDAGTERQRHGLILRGRTRRQEGVVVQQEQRGDDDWSAGTVPNRIGILGGQHAKLAAHPHKVLVALLAAQLHRILRAGPELVIAWRPQHGPESLAQRAERPLDVG
jgi:hypothetical protein